MLQSHGYNNLAGTPRRAVYVDLTWTRSKVKVKVKVTGLVNFRQLAKPCMHAGGDDRQPLAGLSGLISAMVPS